MNSAQTSLSPRVSRPLVGLLCALALAVVPSACMLSVEADVPDVEVTQHDVAFEGVPNASLLGDVSTGMTFSQERPALDLPPGIDSSVQAVKIQMVAKTGITNFNFLRALRISMAPKGSTAAPVELINYEKADGVDVGAILSIPSKNPVNILEQWKADSAVFTVELAGTLPEQAWTVDLSVHFAGKASYKY